MNAIIVEQIVVTTLRNCCLNNGLSIEIKKDTSLIGSNRVLDSLGLVNFIVDIETAFLDIGVEISLTSENAMSSRISPFRTVGSLCRFIENQLGLVNG